MTFSDDKAAIPTFPLYGESGTWSTPEPMHCEEIAARSVLHNWEIQPHRHDDLCQLLFLKSGNAKATLDGQQHMVDGPAAIFVPARAVHGFTFSANVDGHVITMPAFVAKRLLADNVAAAAFLSTPQAIDLQGRPSLKNDIDYLITALAREFAAPRPGRLAALESLLTLLLSGFCRETGTSPTHPKNRNQRLEQRISRFYDLVEKDYAAHRPIDDYAARLGITSVQLNKSLKRATGKSALEITHDRLVLEAKRNLIYTTFSIADITALLGFGDPAYFSRFFSRKTSLSPKRFRQGARIAMREEK